MEIQLIIKYIGIMLAMATHLCNAIIQIIIYPCILWHW